MQSKRGTYGLKDLVPLAIFFVVTIIAISIGAQIIDGVAAKSACLGTNVYNSTDGACHGPTSLWNGTQGNGYVQNVTYAGLQGSGTFGTYMPTIALVLAASIIIGLLVGSFMMGGRN